MGRKDGLVVNVVVVGGMAVVLPIERAWVGGFVGRRLRMCAPGATGDAKW